MLLPRERWCSKGTGIYICYFCVRGWCSKGTGIHLRYFCARGDVSKGTGIHLRYFHARGWCFKGTGRHLATFRKGGNFLKVGGNYAISGTSDNFDEFFRISGRSSMLPEVLPEVPINIPAEFFSCRISLPAAEKSLNSTMIIGTFLSNGKLSFQNQFLHFF